VERRDIELFTVLTKDRLSTEISVSHYSLAQSCSGAFQNGAPREPSRHMIMHRTKRAGVVLKVAMAHLAVRQ
jgi:hypothetical protein